jgi:Flp pilus assembly pilin Flp
MKGLVKRFFRCESGQSRVRLALVLALAAVALMVSLGTLSEGISSTFDQFPASL